MGDESDVSAAVAVDIENWLRLVEDGVSGDGGA